ncbi:MAG TPA: MASE3 domain-containing protein [Rhodocyclaceae bacterium]|nr:MASE3 domain-containing protein [Rhodocyclaceae bacterium]
MAADLPIPGRTAAFSLSTGFLLRWGGFALLLAAIAGTSLYSYVLFHSLVEIFRIVVIFAVAALAWNARSQIDSPFLLLAGLAYPAVGLMELLHTLAYKGMGVFPADANLPTQLWIALRGFESVAIVIAAGLPARRRASVPGLALGFLAAGGTLTGLVLSGRFPDCFVEGQGLTPFKIMAEYAIAGLFATALFLLWRDRAAFGGDILPLVALAMACDILAELAFTQYASVYGAANLVGHLLLLASTYFLYRALLLRGIQRPQLLLFHQLNREKELLARNEAELARKVAERTAEVTKSNRRLKLLSASNQTLLHAADQEELVARMCRAVTEVGGFAGAWIGSPDPAGGGRLCLLGASHAEVAAAFGEARSCLAAPGSPVAEALRTGKPVPFRDCLPLPPLPAAKAGIALPLDGRSGAACLVLWAKEPALLAEEEIPTLEELAADLSFGLTGLRIKNERESGLRALARVMEDTVQAIASTVEMRDPYTAGHQRRVAELSVAIGRELGLAEDRVHAIGLAATIHDLGKITIPAEILTRPGRLSDIEYTLIKTHPDVGHEIIKHIDFPWPIAEAMSQHHERIDGSGYPHGLKGEAIALEARIIGVADVIEAMSSHRPYRPGLGVDAALEEIAKGRGTRFDAEVVDACLRLFRERDFRFSKSWGDRS